MRIFYNSYRFLTVKTQYSAFDNLYCDQIKCLAVVAYLWSLGLLPTWPSIFRLSPFEQVYPFIKISAEIAATLRENKLHLFTCICVLSPSLSIKISLRFLVPIMFRKEVWASSLVEPCASSTLVTDTVAFWILKYTTASTVTVTLSRVRA